VDAAFDRVDAPRANVDASSLDVLTEAIRFVLLRVRVPRYQRDMLVALAARHGKRIHDVLDASSTASRPGTPRSWRRRGSSARRRARIRRSAARRPVGSSQLAAEDLEARGQRRVFTVAGEAFGYGVRRHRGGGDLRAARLHRVGHTRQQRGEAVGDRAEGVDELQRRARLLGIELPTLCSSGIASTAAIIETMNSRDTVRAPRTRAAVDGCGVSSSGMPARSLRSPRRSRSPVVRQR